MKYDLEDHLIITVDISCKDKPTLLVIKDDSDLSFRVVNQLWGEEAIEVYNKLIGNTLMEI